MTRVLFDDDSGRLRLAQEAAGALLSWAEGEEVEPGPWKALREAGVVGADGQPHPTVAPALAAMSEPLCLVFLHTATVDEGSGAHAVGWMGGDSATLLLDAPEEMVEVLSMAPTSVPAALARVLRLSPHPLPDSPGVRQPAGAVEELFSDEPQEGSLAGHPALAAVGASDAEGAFRWEVSTRWPDEEGFGHTSRLRAIDSPGGLWAVTEEGKGDGEVWLHPATATTVWRLLLRLFPT